MPVILAPDSFTQLTGPIGGLEHGKGQPRPAAVIELDHGNRAIFLDGLRQRGQLCERRIVVVGEVDGRERVLVGVLEIDGRFAYGHLRASTAGPALPRPWP